jgi:hypothetical protein
MLNNSYLSVIYGSYIMAERKTLHFFNCLSKQKGAVGCTCATILFICAGHSAKSYGYTK